MGKKILILDDEESICTVLKTLLVGEGYEVRSFCHPTEVLDEGQLGSYDLIISDFNMPGMSGDTLYGLFGMELPEDRIPPIIVVSGYYETERVQKWGRLPGVKAVLDKPFEPDELLELVRKNIGSPRK